MYAGLLLDVNEEHRTVRPGAAVMSLTAPEEVSQVLLNFAANA